QRAPWHESRSTASAPPLYRGAIITLTQVRLNADAATVRAEAERFDSPAESGRYGVGESAAIERRNAERKRRIARSVASFCSSKLMRSSAPRPLRSSSRVSGHGIAPGGSLA